ncbi:hypothetical protein JQU17_19760 [Ponticoccus sp. SC2-23]|nr:hypothetical protein [Ponticoccus sp. SC6-9]MBM1231379.1 hypothetical protein [Ponticoccus sp. SC6-38]MBM1244937.1 hypothetical protein [Ponticoccus sp. SC2-64]MBM1249426.1 hypothetical protein [Ponticoccus sp. SC6-42]MBM1253895.1 hypothetical protein [Ponticoccus sp. SC6-33]MBM1258409.1 hypothetical protein [Ponticoccus sp. SC6-60]MBM1262906.1 hypothetical protein [Ponticoccus sp. SC6-31]MBM1267437.1 hypothetical protein [Ponticoccus sp. SC2-67]MBM1271931.1 hypothetical protein [Pontico
MMPLFTPDAELSALPFLSKHAGRIGLVTPVAEMDLLPDTLHTPGSTAFSGVLKDVEVIPLDENTLDQLAVKSHEKLWLVAASGGEGKTLNALRAACPDHRFAGLGEALFPALVARNPGAIFDRLPQKTHCRQITLIFAPPRSGSSFVADIVSHVTGAKTREHLRNEVIEVLASSYKFNRAAALRNFLSIVTTTDGQASTKIISHFLQDYVARVGGMRLVKQVFEGVAVRTIVIERDDKVAQTVSGYLASRRGIWHLETGRDAKRLEEANKVGYDFDKLLPRYLGYRHQSYVLDFAREIFPDHMALEYGRDIEAGDAAALGERIAEFLGLPWVPGDQPKGRAKLANEENDRLCAQFREDYEALMGRAP